MPTRGYRKGIANTKQPHPHVMKTRITSATYDALHAEAKLRGITMSALLSGVLDAHVTGQRITLPQPRSWSERLIHKLGRIGNNLNQIAHQANLMKLHLLEHETRVVLAAVNAVIARI